MYLCALISYCTLYFETVANDSFVFQAFCLPIIQIVHETCLDVKEGKGSKLPTKATSGGKFLLINQTTELQFLSSL